MDIILTGCKDFKLSVSPPSGVENLSHLIIQTQAKSSLFLCPRA